jgi:hypothetical protein
VKYLLALLLATQAQATELKYLGVDFKKYPGKTYFATLPDETIREEIAVEFDTHLWKCFGWWNRIHGSSTDSQFRWIGWNHRLYCDLPSVELYYEHHSEHSLDRTQPDDHHFPVNDSLGVFWTIYGERVK